MSLQLSASVWEVDCDFMYKLALLWIAEDSSSDGMGDWWRYSPERLSARTQLPIRLVPDLLSVFMRDGVLRYDERMSIERGEAYYRVDLNVWLDTPRYIVVEEQEAPSAERPYRKKVINQNLRRQVFERDAYRCKHCGGWENLCADHVVAEAKGGPTTLENLQTLCRSCNSQKGAR